jgi:DNA topoisomerase-2
MKKQIFLDEYFGEDIKAFSQYAAYRSIASYTDGLKNSQRKVVYTTQEKMGDKIEKVSRLASTVSLETEYLHGETSLEGAIVGLVRNWDKNLCIYDEKGKYGSRAIPKAASSRYIYTKRSKQFTAVFPDEFKEIKESQYFEGNKIEPKTLVSTLPLILINGNSGVGSGYSQLILPHSRETIQGIIEKYLKSKAKDKSKILDVEIPVEYPGYRGIIKTVTEAGQRKTYFSGVVKKKNTTTVEISELPIGYTIATYNKVLEVMIDKKHIVDYRDFTKGNDFRYEIKVRREVIKDKTEDDLLEFFKLKKTQTENFVTTTENNSFRIFQDEKEILKDYIEFTLGKMEELRIYQIEKLQKELSLLSEKARFIKLVMDGKIKIANQKRAQVEVQLKKNNFEEDKTDILISMKIYSLTQEEYNKIKMKEQEKRVELEQKQKETPENLYLKMLKKIF